MDYFTDESAWLFLFHIIPNPSVFYNCDGAVPATLTNHCHPVRSDQMLLTILSQTDTTVFEAYCDFATHCICRQLNSLYRATPMENV